MIECTNVETEVMSSMPGHMIVELELFFFFFLLCRVHSLSPNGLELPWKQVTCYVRGKRGGWVT